MQCGKKKASALIVVQWVMSSCSSLESIYGRHGTVEARKRQFTSRIEIPRLSGLSKGDGSARVPGTAGDRCFSTAMCTGPRICQATCFATTRQSGLAGNKKLVALPTTFDVIPTAVNLVMVKVEGHGEHGYGHIAWKIEK